MKAANTELMNVARRDMPSVFQNRSYGGLCQKNWMAEVNSELCSRYPTVAKILLMLLDCDLISPGKKLPLMCLIYGIIIIINFETNDSDINFILLQLRFDASCIILS
jgi:hypothetical protein